MCTQSETQRPFKRQMKFFKTIKSKRTKSYVAIRLRRNIYNESSRAGSIVSILNLFLFDSCLQISEWECVKHSLSLYLMFTFIWGANWSYVLKLRHRFLICINVYPLCSVSILLVSFFNFDSCVINTSSRLTSAVTLNIILTLRIFSTAVIVIVNFVTQL